MRTALVTVSVGAVAAAVAAAAAAVALLAGCPWISRPQPPASGPAQTATVLVAFSKTIAAYHLERKQAIPPDLDEARLMAILAEAHPRQDEVQAVKATYRLRARAVDGVYALVLCDPQTGRKVMEDLGCTLSRVDFRSWERPDAAPCEFEQDWRSGCP